MNQTTRSRRSATLWNFYGRLPTSRPRTNTLAAAARIRSTLAQAVHAFFDEEGFNYVHSPIITTSDCEGAGEMFRVTSPDGERTISVDPKRKDRLHQRLLAPRLLHRVRTAQRRGLRLRHGRRLHLRPDIPRGELADGAPPRRVLDDRAGDRVRRCQWSDGQRRGDDEVRDQEGSCGL